MLTWCVNIYIMQCLMEIHSVTYCDNQERSALCISAFLLSSVSWQTAKMYTRTSLQSATVFSIWCSAVGLKDHFNNLQQQILKIIQDHISNSNYYSAISTQHIKHPSLTTIFIPVLTRWHKPLLTNNVPKA